MDLESREGVDPVMDLDVLDSRDSSGLVTPIAALVQDGNPGLDGVLVTKHVEEGFKQDQENVHLLLDVLEKVWIIDLVAEAVVQLIASGGTGTHGNPASQMVVARDLHVQ